MVSSKQAESKTKFTLFHKSWDKNNLPLQLPILKINNFEIKRTTSIKFLGIMVDENLTWNYHIHVLENKLSKNIGVLYRAKPYLGKNTMTALYFLFFQTKFQYIELKYKTRESKDNFIILKKKYTNSRLFLGYLAPKFTYILFHTKTYIFHT